MTESASVLVMGCLGFLCLHAHQIKGSTDKQGEALGQQKYRQGCNWEPVRGAPFCQQLGILCRSP